VFENQKRQVQVTVLQRVDFTDYDLIYLTVVKYDYILGYPSSATGRAISRMQTTNFPPKNAIVKDFAGQHKQLRLKDPRSAGRTL